MISCAKKPISCTRAAPHALLACMALTRLTLLFTLLGLAGCGEPPKPEIVLVTKDIRFDAPAECSDAHDPKWVDPPDADVKRSESARLFIANKKVTGDIKANRHICSAAIKAYENPQPQPLKKDTAHG